MSQATPHVYISALCMKALLLALLLAPATFAAPFTVSLTTITDEKTVAGTIKGVETAPARARTGGTLIALYAERGSWVKKGQLLAKVVDSKMEGKSAASDQLLEAAKSRTRLALLNLQRMQSLLPLDAASPAQVEQAESEYQAALSAEAAAQSQSDGRILAPQSGLLTELSAVSGSIVMPGETVAVVAVEPLLVELDIPERHARLLQLNDNIPLTVSSATGASQNLSGKVSRIYPEIHNGLLTVNLTVENLENLKVGEKILAHLKTGTRQGILVPTSYLIHRNGLTFARLQSGTEIVVQPGPSRADSTTEILTGLNGNDVLVTP